MAKKDEQQTSKTPTPAVAVATPAAPPGMRFQIRTPNRGFNRQKHPPDIGVRFVDGVGYTDDPALAVHYADVCRYEVTDTKTDEVRNPLNPTAPEQPPAEPAAR